MGAEVQVNLDLALGRAWVVSTHCTFRSTVSPHVPLWKQLRPPYCIASPPNVRIEPYHIMFCENLGRTQNFFCVLTRCITKRNEGSLLYSL